MSVSVPCCEAEESLLSVSITAVFLSGPLSCCVVVATSELLRAPFSHFACVESE